MTPRARASRARASTALALVLVVLLSSLARAQAGQPPQDTALAGLDLVRQTPVTSPGGTYTAWLGPSGLVAAGGVEVVVHGRVRSRSELATSFDGIGLRAAVYQVVRPVSELPLRPDGSRRLSISLDSANPAGLHLTSGGVYPVELVARDGVGTPTASLITHLLLGPVRADESPPLAVAVVADIGVPPSILPTGEVDVPTRDATRLDSLLEGLAASSGTANLAIRPDLVAALERSERPEHAQLLAKLKEVSSTHPVIAMPFAPTSPDALAAASVGGELQRQLDRGRSTVEDALEVDPEPGAWLAQDDLTPEGAATLAAAGIRHLVLESSQVEPLRSGLSSLSLAQPFLLATPENEPLPDVDGLEVDDGVLARLGGREGVGIEVSRVLAELAMLWFERPGVERSVVVPIDAGVRGEVVAGLLAGLERGGIFEAVTLDDAFDRPDHLRQPGGGEVDRELLSADPAAVDGDVRARLPEGRRLFDSLVTLLEDDADELPAVVDAHLLLATSAAVRPAQQRAHLETAEALMRSLLDGIDAREHETVTLTARDGTVPLTLLNTTGKPIQVVIHLRSVKLEFPEGETVPLVLTGERTRVDIAVKARTSGSIPLDVEVTSPDGQIELATIEYSIQSTAVSGVGVVLSAGAALFLLIWWGRHWSRTRRSAKLVGASHMRSEAPPEQSHAQ